MLQNYMQSYVSPKSYFLNFRFVDEEEMQKWIEKVQEREIREDTDRSATSSSNVVVLIHFLTSEVVASVHDPTSQSNHIIRKKNISVAATYIATLKKI